MRWRALIGFAAWPSQRTKGEYRSGHDPRTLRDALGCFATGVTVVTCLNDGEPGRDHGQQLHLGLARSAAAARLPRTSRRRARRRWSSASHFAINVLQTGQQPASITFSTRVEDRFGPTPWSCGEAGAPILEDSLGVFECERYAVYDGGDHHILVGQVVKASFDARLDPLLYFRGSYRRLHFD